MYPKSLSGVKFKLDCHLSMCGLAVTLSADEDFISISTMILLPIARALEEKSWKNSVILVSKSQVS